MDGFTPATQPVPGHDLGDQVLVKVEVASALGHLTDNLHRSAQANAGRYGWRGVMGAGDVAH